MEAAIQNRASVHELSSQHICTRIVQPNTLKNRNKPQHRIELRDPSIEETELGFATYLVPGGYEKVVAMIGEAEIGDPICRRVHELPADYRGVHSCHSVIVGVAFRVRVLGGREGGSEGEREGDLKMKMEKENPTAF